MEDLDDPYDSHQKDMLIFATNEEHNADLTSGAAHLRKQYSSLEDGEVRDDDEEDSVEDCSDQAAYMRFKGVDSDSQALDEENFFFGGGQRGDLTSEARDPY